LAFEIAENPADSACRRLVEIEILWAFSHWKCRKKSGREAYKNLCVEKFPTIRKGDAGDCNLIN